MEKSELRKELVKIRLAVKERENKNEIIMREVLRIAEKYDRIFIYVSMGSEVDTHEIIRALGGVKQIFVPYTVKGIMRAAVPLYSDKPFTPDGRGNVPVRGDGFFDGEADLNIVPLLGYDDGCYRVGYGAGCYDRYFEKFNGGLKVGLAYAEQHCVFTREQTDIPLDMIVTQSGILGRNK